MTRELDQQAAEEGEIVLPSRNHAVVLVSKLHMPTLRALAYARATRPDTLEAITVGVDDADPRAGAQVGGQRYLRAAQGDRLAIPGDHPPGARLRQAGQQGVARTVVTVFIPEYVVGHWWEQVLHNQSALRLKGRLLFDAERDGDVRSLASSSSERLKTLQPQRRRATPQRLPGLTDQPTADPPPVAVELTVTTGPPAKAAAWRATKAGWCSCGALPGERVKVRWSVTTDRIGTPTLSR